MPTEVIPSSFRDPSGFLFQREKLIYRQVNQNYREHYDQLMESGLYQDLVDNGLLVAHEEVGLDRAVSKDAYKVLKPEFIPFISYPYEWCFSQLKDAALLTLTIQKKALELGMSLKDCSAYNVQFKQGRPIFIDSLSFERYEEGKPWVAYRQFCQHFLAPLALMSHTHINLSQLSRIYIDGVPLDLASSLLPMRTRAKFSLLSHIHIHAKTQKRFADKPVKTGRAKVSNLAFRALIDNLETTIKKLSWRPAGTEWGDYYDNTNYSSESLENKKTIMSDFVRKVAPIRSLWDLGANTGVFSRLAVEMGIPTISFDVDPAAVEKNYLQANGAGEDILPLVLDLSNPSPSIGWKNEERMSFIERGPVDMAFALALIHHLAIANNLPLSKCAEFFSHICGNLAIEFVPKGDSQVQKLLASREDIFPDYNQESFEREFGLHFDITESLPIPDTKRTMYLMVKKNLAE